MLKAYDILHKSCYTGDLQKAEKVFEPIRSFKEPALDFVGPMPFTAIQTMFDQMYPPGLQWYWKALFAKDLDDAAIDIYIKDGSLMPTLLSTMHIYPINGAAARIGKDETAWNHRDTNYAVVIIGIENNPANNNTIISWARDYWTALQPYSVGGGYVNFIMDEGEERVKSVYGDSYKRLAEIKAKYDPDNLFRVNQNIKPHH